MRYGEVMCTIPLVAACTWLIYICTAYYYNNRASSWWLRANGHVEQFASRKFETIFFCILAKPGCYRYVAMTPETINTDVQAVARNAEVKREDREVSPFVCALNEDLSDTLLVEVGVLFRQLPRSKIRSSPWYIVSTQ